MKFRYLSIVLILLCSCESEYDKQSRKERGYSFSKMKSFLFVRPIVSERGMDVNTEDYYETTYEYGKAITRKRNDSYRKQTGFSLIARVENRLKTKRFINAKIRVHYVMNLEAAWFYEPCPRISIGRCDNYERRESYTMSNLSRYCDDCSEIDLLNLEGKRIVLTGGAYEVEFQKDFKVILPAGSKTDLEVVIPKKVYFGKNKTDYTYLSIHPYADPIRKIVFLGTELEIEKD